MKRQNRTNDDAQVDMTPMLDIVFIMLIFFIVTTTFSNELGLASERPPISSSDPVSTSLSIQIDEMGQISMLGRVVDIRRVVANTQTFLAEHQGNSAAIQAHENTEHGIVVAVMDQIKQAGIEKVQILVKQD